jgi:uncharacterized protein YqeY
MSSGVQQPEGRSMLRENLSKALKEVDESTDPNRAATLRLICVAIRDREQTLVGDAVTDGVADADVLPILERMIDQREESARSYEEAGRLGLAEQEREEIAVISEFLPRKLSEDQMTNAIDATLSEVGATSIRDLGKVMGTLKQRYPGQLDFCKAGSVVKKRLCNRAQA